MLSYLADLESYWGPLRVFRYLTFRTICAAVTATLIGELTKTLKTGGYRPVTLAELLTSR